jgi:geranylgeranyl pyrophosphate synthase
MSQATISEYLHEVRELLGPDLKKTLDSHNKSQILHEAMSYSLLNTGKALRAGLCMMTCELLGGSKEDALAAAVALECIHSYSLIHDDLPSMDDDDLRRGQPSNHKVHGEAMAILAGDGLQSMAFLKISESYPAPLATRLTNLIASAAVKMAAGQSLDISEEQFADEASLQNMHRLKTGAMFKAAVLMGAACAGLEDSDPRWDSLEFFSKKIGLAFQISDDILDVIGTDDVLGKTAGKDQDQKKATYVSLLGLEGAQKKLDMILDEASEQLEQLFESAIMLMGVIKFIKNRDH